MRAGAKEARERDARAASRHTREIGARSSDLHSTTAMVLPIAIANSMRPSSNSDNDSPLLGKSAFDTSTCTARPLVAPRTPSHSLACAVYAGSPTYAWTASALLSHVRAGYTDALEEDRGEKWLVGGRPHGEPTTGRAQTSNPSQGLCLSSCRAAHRFTCTY